MEAEDPIQTSLIEEESLDKKGEGKEVLTPQIQDSSPLHIIEEENQGLNFQDNDDPYL
jgi:hypothetical protein